MGTRITHDLSLQIPGVPEEVAGKIRTALKWRSLPERGTFGVDQERE